MEVDPDIYANKTILDTSELQALCSALNIQYNLLDLSQLNSNSNFYSFVHTGEKANNYNSGLTNHWLAVYGPNVFDSYGKYSAWKIPPGYNFVETVPAALQEYNTNVCGMYATAYLDFCINSNSDGSDDLGREF